MLHSLCKDWIFTENWTDAFAMDGPGQRVELPHNVCPVPLHYTDHNSYQMLCGYRRTLQVLPEHAGKRLFLQFDGAAHIATVYVNGTEAAHHRTGYTGFRVEITDLVHPGENVLAVKLDTTENPQIPPFGFLIDYLTYGGLYREVWLDVREKSYIADIFVTCPTLQDVHVELQLAGAEHCRLSLLDAQGQTVHQKEYPQWADIHVPNARVWCCSDPYRYTLRCELLDSYGNAVDSQEVKFGIRTVRFAADGFYLNGEKVFLRGLNRHQCYPYIGYAATESLQREDARILKEELGCNAVRTSHYPQSHHFIDECDRLGLLVFTEIPGWQHLGDEGWKEQACENVKEMVLQYRNHPSIVLWGVRVNESMDCDELYARTNAICHSLDPSRPTSGVRYLQKSSLLEDVYAYNDFSHTGNNGGALPKKKVTPDSGKALLISEHSGHMFPTKSFDPWPKRQDHALRHARVLHDAMADGGHVGCFGWCMFDYATHRDFGSGDRICYHGVMDAFRNPKLAASVYASQQEDFPVLTIGSPMDIGDYPGGQIGDIYAFTNADEVRLYRNDAFVDTLRRDHWDALPHGPQRVADTVGCLLETQEGFDKRKANLLRKCLIAIGKKGLSGLSAVDLARIAWAMLRYKLTMDDAMTLYSIYVGNWGGASVIWRFDAIRNGKVVASATCGHSTKLHLEVRASTTSLQEGSTYDMAAVRVQIVDEYGNIAPYAQLPVQWKLEGCLELIGPHVSTAEGGMCGTYLRTTGKSGSARLTVSADGLDDVTVDFQVE